MKLIDDSEWKKQDEFKKNKNLNEQLVYMIIYIKMKMRILSFSKGLLVANSFHLQTWDWKHVLTEWI